MNQETLQNLALFQAIHSQEAQLCQTSDFQLESFQAASASSLLSSLSLSLALDAYPIESHFICSRCFALASMN